MDIYEKSLEILKKIIKNQERLRYKIYLMGGWAVWIYNPYMKSKDIDFIIHKKDFWKIRDLLLDIGFRMTSDILGKKGFAMLWDDDKIEIDVYDERVGKFNVKNFIKNSVKRKFNHDGIFIVSVSDLLLLKLFAVEERLGSRKGEKDLSDILALLDLYYEEIDFTEMRKFKEIFRILFRDFKYTSRNYPMKFENFQKIKEHLKNLKIL